MSASNLTYFPLPLSLKRAFTIARGTKKRVENILVRLEHEGIVGYGEAAPNKRYGETPEKVKRFLDNLSDELWADKPDPYELNNRLDRRDPRIQSARCAVETAYLDWFGKKMGRPVYRWLGGRNSIGPVSSYTLGMDDPKTIREKLKEARDYPILKVKLGGSKDRKMIELIRRHTDKPLYVDVNEGWKSLRQAKREVDFLNQNQVVLLEQPLPADHNWDELCKFRSYSPITVCADEGFKGTELLSTIKQAYDCINIKLMKTGSLLKSHQLIQQAHREGIKVLIGCMIQSSLADTASAILSLWSDFADIDGRFLIKEDPFDGVELSADYHLKLPEVSGIGARPTEKWRKIGD